MQEGTQRNAVKRVMSNSPFRFDNATTIKAAQTHKRISGWQSIARNDLSELELLILSLVYELQYCTAAQIKDFMLISDCEKRFKRFSSGNNNPYRNPIHALIRKGLINTFSVFRNHKSEGPSILQLSTTAEKLMQLVLKKPQIFECFPKRLANDACSMLGLLVRNASCISLIKCSNRGLLTLDTLQDLLIPHICLSTRVHGDILILPYRNGKNVIMDELKRFDDNSYQAYIIITETLEDAQKLNNFLCHNHINTPLLYSTDASLKNPEIPLMKHLYQFFNERIECLELSIS